MSNAEHLIENAIMCFEKHGNFDYFRRSKCNIEMAASVGVSLADIEKMAIYVLFVLKPEWEYEAEDKLVKQYGYDVRGT